MMFELTFNDQARKAILFEKVSHAVLLPLFIFIFFLFNGNTAILCKTDQTDFNVSGFQNKANKPNVTT